MFLPITNFVFRVGSDLVIFRYIIFMYFRKPIMNRGLCMYWFHQTHGMFIKQTCTFINATVDTTNVVYSGILIQSTDVIMINKIINILFIVKITTVLYLSASIIIHACVSYFFISLLCLRSNRCLCCLLYTSRCV